MDFKLKKSNLNFRVYTATETPATGTENDIAIITETPMKNWVMSPDAPRGTPRRDGDVWIQYATDGEVFNVVKSGSLLLSIAAVYQFINGLWVEVPYTTYRNETWDDIWKGELFKNGEQYTDITGGWSKDGYMYYRASYVHLTPTIGETITVDASRTVGTDITTCIAGIQKQIDITDYNTISLDVLSVTGECYLVVLNNSNMNTHVSYALKSMGLTEAGKVELDVSDLTGLVHIALVAVYSSESRTNVCEVNNIKLS